MSRLDTIQELALRERVVRVLDTGARAGHVVVFFGGLGTSAGAYALTELTCSEGDRRGLRFVSVERNGFGDTDWDPDGGFAEAVDDVLGALQALEVERFSVVAISGGGPYAARVAAAVPGQVASLHLAAATAGGAALSRGAASDLLRDIDAIAADPEAFWEYPPSSLVHSFPGFMECARAEGRHSLGDPVKAAAALRHEVTLLSSSELPDLRALSAPAYLYWGEEDRIVPLEHMRAWQRALGRPGVARVYPGIGHDVQYVHWTSILRDIKEAA